MWYAGPIQMQREVRDLKTTEERTVVHCTNVWMLGASPVQSHPLGMLTCTYITHATHGIIHTYIKSDVTTDCITSLVVLLEQDHLQDYVGYMLCLGKVEALFYPVHVHCKSKIVILANFWVATVAWNSFPSECTSLASHQIFYVHCILWIGMGSECHASH